VPTTATGISSEQATTTAAAATAQVARSRNGIGFVGLADAAAAHTGTTAATCIGGGHQAGRGPDLAAAFTTC